MEDLSLVLPILCDDVPWMTLEEFPSLFFYILSLCLHFITCSHWGQCAFQVWGEGLENNCCFMFLLFLLLFVFLYFVSVFVCVSIFCFCLAIFCYVYFSVVVCCFFFVVVFYFLSCCIYFVSLFYYFLHTENKKGKNLQFLFSNVFVELRHFYIGFLTCINCERCIIFSWEVSCLMWTIVAIVDRMMPCEFWDFVDGLHYSIHALSCVSSPLW